MIWIYLLQLFQRTFGKILSNNLLKILFLGAINQINSPRGGEEYKNQLLVEKFLHISEYSNCVIDTYNWKNKPFLWVKLFYQLLFNDFDYVIISASSASTFRLLQIIKIIKSDLLAKTHYFVIGGYFPEGIKTKRYNWETYIKLKSIVLEGEILKNQLLECTDLTNIRVVPNFKKFDISLSLNNGLSDKSTFKFVFVGRISRAKGIDEIFDAVEFIQTHHSDLKFEVDFFGPIEDQFEFSDDLPIQYKGYLDIMSHPEKSYQKLSEYSCMLFPTYWQGEGFPGVVIDAYVAGLPVIATDWNMNQEVVEDGETGIIIPIKSAKDLVTAMVELMENPMKLEKMRMNSKAKAKDFHIDTVWPEIEKLLK